MIGKKLLGSGTIDCGQIAQCPTDGLGNEELFVRAALITAINIPLALLFAFSGMVWSGTAANLISLGAVDFGIVVDSTVIVMESIFVNFLRKGGSAFDRVVAANTGIPLGEATWTLLRTASIRAGVPSAMR